MQPPQFLPQERQPLKFVHLVYAMLAIFALVFMFVLFVCVSRYTTCAGKELPEFFGCAFRRSSNSTHSRYLYPE